ncbi:MAG: PAAR domain-containing protein [Byssovorax sp.]
MSGQVVLSAARQTDRISHNCRIDKHDSQALLGVTLGALTSAAGSGGAISSQVGAGASATGGRRTMAIELRELIPNTTSGKVEEGSPDTFLGKDKLPAAAAGAQKVSCDHHKDKPIKMGSTTVFVNKKRLSRQTDETECGAQLCDGEMTVLVGGAPTDEAPEDPLTKLTEGATVALSALGAALTAGADAVETALSYGQTLVDKVAGAAEQVIESATVAEGEIAASIGSLLGSLEGAILGPTYGQKIGDKAK